MSDCHFVAEVTVWGGQQTPEDFGNLELRAGIHNSMIDEGMGSRLGLNQACGQESGYASRFFN